MTNLLNTLAARLTQQARKFMGQANGPIDGKAITVTLEHLKEPGIELPQGWTASQTKINRLGQAQEATRAQDAPTFLKKGDPLVTSQHGEQIAHIDHIEGLIRKLKRISDIHDLKGGIDKVLATRSCVGIIYHESADVDASDFDSSKLDSYVQHPITGSTTNIKHLLPLCCVRPVYASQRAAHRLGQQLALVGQARHFAGAFRIKNICAFGYGLFVEGIWHE